MDNRPPLFLMMAQMFSQAECARLIEESDTDGWQKGTVIDGSPIRDSDIRDLNDPGSEWVVRTRRIAAQAAPVLGIDITPTQLDGLQVGRYAPGQYYDWHIDHDTGRQYLSYDRKLSVVASLTDGGGLELDHVGDFCMNAGDVLVFSGILRHRAPTREHLRHTMVAWVPGPCWR